MSARGLDAARQLRTPIPSPPLQPNSSRPQRRMSVPSDCASAAEQQRDLSSSSDEEQGESARPSTAVPAGTTSTGGHTESVKVVVRVRPPLSGESCTAQSVVVEGGQRITVSNHAEARAGPKLVRRSFDFHRVMTTTSSQQEVWQEVQHVAEAVKQGYNGAIIAYGQTGSGKTFTMEGPDVLDEQYKGVLPRAIELVMCEDTPGDTDVVVRVAHIEIYMEQIRDLLNQSKNNLAVREDTGRGLWITDATEVIVNSTAEAFDQLRLGRYLYLKNCSESVSKSRVEGQQLDEAKMINTSLLALSQVTHALVAKAKQKAKRRYKGQARPKIHVPYRDSKLTRLLQNSFGGNSRTALIVTVNPNADQFAETLSSLRFGEMSACIRNKPKVNQQVSLAEVRLQLAASQREVTRVTALNKQLEAEVRKSRKLDQMQKHLRRAGEQDEGSRKCGGIFSTKDRERFEKDGLKHLLCPLSGQIMNNPAVAADGFSYERAAIERYLNGNDVLPPSPVTGGVLSSKQIVPNYTLRVVVLQQAGNVTTFSWLPDHILSEILSELPTECISKCVRVSKQLSLLASEDDLWWSKIREEEVRELRDVPLDRARAAYYQYRIKAQKRAVQPNCIVSSGLRLVSHN